MNFLNNLSKKEKISLLSMVILVVAIPLAMYLVRQTQIFKPKATNVVCASDQNNEPVSQTCIDGIKFLIFEYAEGGQCKLFYEPTSDSCSGNPSPSPSSSSSPTPSPSPSASPSPSSSSSPSPSPSSSVRPVVTPPPDGSIGAVCYPNKAIALVNENITWRVDAEGGVRPYSLSWGGDAPLNLVGDNNNNEQTVRYITPGTKTAVVRVRDSSNLEKFPQCPTIVITAPSPSPSASSSPSPSASPSILPSQSPSPSPSSSPAVKPGDIDRDGDVDIFDYNLFIQDFVSGNTRSDLNGDGILNIFDYNILVQNFGR